MTRHARRAIAHVLCVRCAGLFLLGGLAAAQAGASPLLFTDRSVFQEHLSRQMISNSGLESFESDAVCSLGSDEENCFFKTGSPSLDFGDVTVSSSRLNVTNKSRFVTDGDKAIKAVPGGWSWEDGEKQWKKNNNAENNAYGPVTLTFTQSLNFLAMDITDLGTSDGQSVLTGRLSYNTTVFDILRRGRACETTNTDGNVVSTCIQGISGGNQNVDDHNQNFLEGELFFGLISVTAFNTIELGLRRGDSGDGFVLDDFVGFDNLEFGAAEVSDVPVTGSLWLMFPGLFLLGRRIRVRLSQWARRFAAALCAAYAAFYRTA